MCLKSCTRRHAFFGEADYQQSFWAGAYYRQQRAKGSSYQAAVRALAFKWIRILYRCWQTGMRYDESIYLNALRKRGSPLLQNLRLPGYSAALDGYAAASGAGGQLRWTGCRELSTPAGRLLCP